MALSQLANIVNVVQPFMTMFGFLTLYFSIYLKPRNTCGEFLRFRKNNEYFVFNRKKGRSFGTTALWHTQPSEAKKLKTRELCTEQTLLN